MLADMKIANANVTSDHPRKGSEMKFRKKPVVIEAEQFDISKPHIPQGVYRDRNEHEKYRIDTLEGPLNVSNMDWIITGVHGERYPCKPDIFEATYEKV